MGRFCHFYHICDLLQQPFDLLSVFISLARVKDKADSLKAFDPLLILGTLTGEITAWEADFGQILSKCFVVLINANNPVNDLCPVDEGFLVTDEEVIFIEDP